MQSPIGRRLCGSIAHDGVAAGQHFGDGVLDDHDAADVPGRSGAGAAGLTDIAATCVLAVRVVMALRDDDGRPASSRIESVPPSTCTSPVSFAESPSTATMASSHGLLVVWGISVVSHAACST